MSIKSLRYMAALSSEPICEQVALVANTRQEITANPTGQTGTKVLEIVLQANATVYIGGSDV